MSGGGGGLYHPPFSSGGGGGGAAGTNTLGMSNLGNTSGTSGVITGTALRYLFAGGNNITLSQSINGSTATLTISAGGGAAGVHTLGMSNLGNTSGTTGVITGSALQFILAGGNNVTLSQSIDASSATITISAFNQSVQPEGTQTFGMSNLGNTSGTTGVVTGTGIQFILAGGNNITLSQSIDGSSGTITISAWPGTPATTVSQVESANVVGTRTSRFALEDHQHVGVFSAGVSNIGNTSGDTGVRPGRWVFVGGNNITLSQGTAAGSLQTITISAPNQTNQQMTLFATGNTTQSSTGTTNASSIIFRGEGIASIGITNGSIVVSVPSGGGGGDGGVFAGVSTDGNTAGSTGTVSTGPFVLVGSHGITLSQSTGAAGASATVTALGPIYTHYCPNTGELIGSVWPGDAQPHFRPASFPYVEFDRLVHGVRFSNATNSTGSVTITLRVGIYTKNVSTLSLLHSSSTTLGITFSGTVRNSLHMSERLITMGWTSTIQPGNYYIGFLSRTTTGGANASLSNNVISQLGVSFAGHLGVASNASNQWVPGQGVYSASSTALPTAPPFSDIRGTGIAAGSYPWIYFHSGTV